MSGQFIRVSEGFWNIRGSFKIAGVIDVGTQASLVRLTSGKFVLLDSYTLSGAVKRQVNELTAYTRTLTCMERPATCPGFPICLGRKSVPRGLSSISGMPKISIFQCRVASISSRTTRMFIFPPF
jgi:hypothetical protein